MTAVFEIRSGITKPEPVEYDSDKKRCATCGEVPPAEGYKDCYFCGNNRRRISKGLPPRLVRGQVSVRKDRPRFCVHCGVRPPGSTVSECWHCADNRRRKNLGLKPRRTREDLQWRPKKCRQCGIQGAKPGSTECSNCAEDRRRISKGLPPRDRTPKTLDPDKACSDCGYLFMSIGLNYRHKRCSPCTKKYKEMRLLAGHSTATKKVAKEERRCSVCRGVFHQNEFNILAPFPAYSARCSDCRNPKVGNWTMKTKKDAREFFGNVCGICGVSGDEEMLGIDHCHTTGLIRGLLCRKENSAIGFFGEDLDKLRAAIAYLESVEIPAEQPVKLRIVNS